MQNENRYIYLKVTSDEYELPLDVADTARELARRQGTAYETILSGAWHAENGGRKSKWRRVRL